MVRDLPSTVSPMFSPATPPQRLLLGPGPSPVEPTVLQAMAKPVVGHLDPAFLQLMDEVSEMLRGLFRTANRLTFPISGTGSAGMQAAVFNMIEPGDRMVVGINGVFGARMADAARRAGAVVREVTAPWGRPIDVDALGKAAKQHGAKVVGLVHAETSTGLEQPLADVRAAIGPDRVLIVDSVTGLAGSELRVDAWGIDVCFSGTQKCLSVPPGLAPITFSHRAEARLDQRTTKVASWYLDVAMIRSYWQDGASSRSYHHTAPISMIYGLHEGLRLVQQEGLESRWARHRDVGNFLQGALEDRGWELFAQEGHRLAQLTSVRLPQGVSDDLRNRLLHDFGIEVGGGLGELGGKGWRIGLMGFGARRANALRFLQAIDSLVR